MLQARSKYNPLLLCTSLDASSSIEGVFAIAILAYNPELRRTLKVFVLYGSGAVPVIISSVGVDDILLAGESNAVPKSCYGIMTTKDSEIFDALTVLGYHSGLAGVESGVNKSILICFRSYL